MLQDTIVGGVASSWAELVDQAQKASDDRRILMERVSAEVSKSKMSAQDRAKALAEPIWLVAENSILLGPERARNDAAVLQDDFDKALKQLYAHGAPIHYEACALYLVHFNTLHCCGFELKREQIATEKKIFKLISEKKRFLKDDTRRVVAFAAMALGEVSKVPKLLGGGALKKKLKAGETFGYNEIGFARYLATAIAIGSDPVEVYPAWIDFLQRFPQKLASETLGFHDLLYAGRALAAFIDRESIASVALSLHTFTTGSTLPNGAEAYSQPARQQQTPKVSYDAIRKPWAKTLKNLKTRKNKLYEYILDDVEKLEKLPDASSFRSFANRIALWGLTLDAAQTKGCLDRTDACFPQLLERLGEGITEETFFCIRGVLGYVNASRCFGGSPVGATPTQENEWLEGLVPWVKKLDKRDRQELAFSSLTNGCFDLVPIFVGGGKIPKRFKPNQPCDADVKQFIRYLTTAAVARANPADIQLAWLTFLRDAPGRFDGGTLGSIELLYLARAVGVHFENRQISETGAFLQTVLGFDKVKKKV